MGGSVAVTIRQENGTEHRFHNRYTNPLPFFIDNMRLIEKNEKHIEDYINGGDPEYVIKGDCLSPDGYGLVVVDLKTNHILSYQNYCSFGRTAISSIMLDLEASHISAEGVCIGGFGSENKKIGIKAFSMGEEVQNRAMLFGEFFLDKRIKSIDVNSSNGKPAIQDFPEDIKNGAIEDLYKFLLRIANINKSKYTYYGFNLDMSPFTVIRFDQNRKGLKAMKKKIKELGFVLSPKEKQVWTTFENENF